jgi:hypothetical protein
MSISSAPAATAASVSSTLTASGDWPDGNAVATLATWIPVPRSASTAVGTRVGYTQTAATEGQVRSAGSGRRALAHRARTFPGVSAPSSVVRSTMRIARSRAQALALVLIERVPSIATRASAPTWSTPGSPCRNVRRLASDRATSTTAVIPRAYAAGESVILGTIRWRPWT